MISERVKLYTATIVVGVGAILTPINPVIAVPVVPNFQQGSMTSHTETTSKVTETINSMDYSTGYQYTATGTGITASGDLHVVSPDTSTSTVTIDGVTSTWTGMDLENKPNFVITTPGAGFQYTESYSGPGLATQTIIQRVTDMQSVTETTSVFSQ